MPVINDTYDQLKIDKLKYFLEDMAGKGHARPFEIFVDSLKCVPKTEDPKDFDSFEYYMNENTEKIRILIYNSNLSPRNDQYCFYVQQQKQSQQQQPTGGLGEIDNIIQEKLTARDREHELGRLQNELEETKKQLEEAEEYAETLEQQLEESKTNKYKLGKIDLVEFGGVLIEKLAMKNSPALEKMGLGGFVNAEAKQPSSNTEESHASYQKKPNADASGTLNEQQLRYLSILEEMGENFDDAQLESIMHIIRKFNTQPEQVKIVADLLNIETK